MCKLCVYQAEMKHASSQIEPISDIVAGATAANATATSYLSPLLQITANPESTLPDCRRGILEFILVAGT
jgi:hypothetical protein